MMIRHRGGKKKGMKQPKKEKSLNSKFAITTISSANCYQEALSLSLSLYPRVAQASEQAHSSKQASTLALPGKLVSKAMRQQEQRWRPHTYLVPTYPPTSLVLVLPVFF
jgi:transglutaminase/protease-like cytokinesis protein 3